MPAADVRRHMSATCVHSSPLSIDYLDPIFSLVLEYFMECYSLMLLVAIDLLFVFLGVFNLNDLNEPASTFLFNCYVLHGSFVG